MYDKDYAAPFEYTGMIDLAVIDVAERKVDERKEIEKELHVD